MKGSTLNYSKEEKKGNGVGLIDILYNSIPLNVLVTKCGVAEGWSPKPA